MTDMTEHKGTTMNKPMNSTLPECAFEVASNGPDDVSLYVVFGGKRIAKRGEPGTPYAKQWVSLEPGYVVRDITKDELLVEYYGVQVN